MRRNPLVAIAVVTGGLLAASLTQAEQQRSSPPSSPARAVLYEEDLSDPTGKQYAGSVVWRIVTDTPKSGAAVEPAIRAEVEVPERGITMTFVLRRTPDQTQATHRLDVSFDLSASFASGGIQNVPGLLMKPSEQTRGAPLAGLARKIDATSFQVDLSANAESKERNLRLLKDRSWFDVPIIFANGRRAILAFEKGTSGEEAFDAVFTAWGQ
jgi:hypothetical protein